MKKTKRGKGTKLMAVADGFGLSLAVYTESAALYEVRLVDETFRARFTDERPRKLIGDKAYDSNPLDEKFAGFEPEMIRGTKRI